jgi:hypothetical protein
MLENIKRQNLLHKRTFRTRVILLRKEETFNDILELEKGVLNAK